MIVCVCTEVYCVLYDNPRGVMDDRRKKKETGFGGALDYRAYTDADADADVFDQCALMVYTADREF